MTPTISRRLPIINGFVPVPDDQIVNPTTLTPEQVLALIPGSRVVKIGVHESDPSFIELPSFTVAAPEDWYAILKAAAQQ